MTVFGRGKGDVTTIKCSVFYTFSFKHDPKILNVLKLEKGATQTCETMFCFVFFFPPQQNISS